MRFDSKDHYPEYYKNVFIEYCPSDSDRYLIAEGWLSVDDNGEYIWTLVDSNIIIEDKQVVNWTNFGIQLVYMAWVAVNKYGSEQMFRNRPMRFRSFLVDYQELGKISEVLKRDFDEDCSIDMPSGTIEKIIGRKLTWDDEPVEI